MERFRLVVTEGNKSGRFKGDSDCSALLVYSLNHPKVRTGDFEQAFIPCELFIVWLPAQITPVKREGNTGRENEEDLTLELGQDLPGTAKQWD